ncbi:putative 8-amino-7-oxononanoate synthase [Cupriavidus taiwanensis]|uniref:aminotransferase class I/II-fold pyridoxal phosphate-dependent enzyme n=1 Tax=Cupriavidus taiwanensis TaxID=164546 RepID=UPI000E10CCD8|nr:aminotransferase class I/II-fold pyridoxal phosphate-dependent enzyme [Cupriavidus taiwanensis]ULX50889.1 8-amino-7-oxononanoate synthase [Cupriavidus taiwanensis]SPA40944.1 putative 8-amino-7-oxononanoate synthase [Cupriavidus taiwanensis]SPA41872.1 putative 8-amino-7-oxononanoate synthase [Cupriavidus taiwanensis]
MIDFASALYLGMSHPAAQLGSYAALTTGTPAALAVSPLAGTLAAQAAALQGCEAGLAGPSTLHLSLDLFDRLGRTHALVADDTLYPVMRWGLERVRGLGAPVTLFRHADLADLARRLRQGTGTRPPAVVTDGTRREGAPVALSRYLALVRERGGLVVVDHTQLLGLAGAQPGPGRPWGSGGGGLLRYAGLTPAEPVLLLASWAKAFGAPLATLCGPAALVGEIARDGPTQAHCSAASQAALLAGLNALARNGCDGDALRAALLERVRRLRRGLRWLAQHRLPDLQASVPLHPMQQLRLGSAGRTRALHAGLRAAGFRTALLRQAEGRCAVAVVVRASHAPQEIDGLLAALALLAGQPAAPRGRAPPAYRESLHVQDCGR